MTLLFFIAYEGSNREENVMTKDELYEYQYTTPSKKVVKECLPAVKKPDGKKKQKNKVFLGKVLILIGAIGMFGTLDRLMSFSNPIILLIKVLLYGTFLIKGGQSVKSGKEYLGRIDRYYRYMKALEDKKYMSLEELSEKVSKSIKTVTKDLEFMMEKKWFKEGHLDYSGGQFLLTDHMYEQYKLLEQGKKIKEQEEKEKQEIQNDPVKRELAKVLEEGRSYIKEIRVLNDEILGENISNRLYKIEDVLESIFEVVKRHPKKLPELRKLMQYYLPMTIKVVTAYRDFENERIQSEQLEEGKREIEETLEKVHTAFVNLREKLFQDDVLDVSTDLDVLETLMGQEGLIDGDTNIIS